jgi:peptide chain release factor
VCTSPFRPHHKRKNWYVDVSVCTTATADGFDPSLVRVETFRSPGRGGQHVNKTETGVRVVYLPTGDTATSTDERSQHRNRQTALNRLVLVVAQRATDARSQADNDNWREHNRIVRGDPVRIYHGPGFVRAN